MVEYIDRQAAIDALGEEPEIWCETDEEAATRSQWEMDKAAIESVQPADVRPVVRGEWAVKTDREGKTYGVCNQCGYKQYAGHLKFCPNCGADMREHEEKPKKDPFEGWSEELKETYRNLLANLHLEGGDAE